MLADPTFGTEAIGEGTRKLDQRQKTPRNKLYREMKRRKMESHKIKKFSNGDMNNSSQSSKERSEFMTVIDDSSGTSSDEEEQPQKSSSPYDEDEKEPNTVVIEVSDSESSQWSLCELSPVKNIKPTAEFDMNNDNENISSISASENGDNEGSLDENMSGIDYSSDDMDGAFTAKMDSKKSQKTIADLRKKVKNLQSRNRTLTKKVHCLNSFLSYLEKNNFLNQYAGAAVKAVLSERTEPP